MALQTALMDVLNQIAGDAVDGRLDNEAGYNTSMWRDRFCENGQRGADEICDHLDGRVWWLTEGKRRVILADPRYFATYPDHGLTFAIVPFGFGADSPEARLFFVGVGPHGVGSSEHASQTDFEADYVRRDVQAMNGGLLMAQLTGTIRTLALKICLTGGTPRQSSDLEHALRCFGGHTPLEKIQRAGLPELLTALSIYGVDKLNPIF